jgi:hypothetical protein
MEIPAEKLMIMSIAVSFLRNSVDGIMGTCCGNIRATARPGPRKYSYPKNAMHSIAPSMKGAMTAAELHAYCVPPHCTARMMSPTPRMNMTRPGQSMIARPLV